MRGALYLFVISLRPSRNPSFGKTTPIFPAIGSTMTAAISFPICSNTSFTFSMSLYGREMVFFAISLGTPGLPGMPNVAIPDPAATRRLSEWP